MCIQCATDVQLCLGQLRKHARSMQHAAGSERQQRPRMHRQAAGRGMAGSEIHLSATAAARKDRTARRQGPGLHPTHQRRLWRSWTSGPAAQTPRAPGPRLQAQHVETRTREWSAEAAVQGTSCRHGKLPPPARLANERKKPASRPAQPRPPVSTCLAGRLRSSPLASRLNWMNTRFQISSTLGSSAGRGQGRGRHDRPRGRQGERDSRPGGPGRRDSRPGSGRQRVGWLRARATQERTP